jgi:hypothetical protein
MVCYVGRWNTTDHRVLVSPLFLCTAVVMNFSSAELAVPATIAKTLGISAAIVVYTICSMVFFPNSATQKVRWEDVLGLVTTAL